MGVPEYNDIIPALEIFAGDPAVFLQNLFAAVDPVASATPAGNLTSQADTESRMKGLIDILGKVVAQQPAENTVGDIFFPYSFSMEQTQPPALEADSELARMQMEAEVGTHERTEGEIMVPHAVMNGRAIFDQRAESVENAEVIGPDGGAVFDPEIEEITEDKEVFCSGNCLPQKGNKGFFPPFTARDSGAEVSIGDKIRDLVSHIGSIPPLGA